MRYDNQSVWCICEMISCVTDEYKAMDDIPEEEVINLVENHLTSTRSTNQDKQASTTRPSSTFFPTSEIFSVGTIKTSSDPVKSQGTSTKRKVGSNATKNNKEKEVIHNQDTPIKRNSVENSTLFQQPSRVIQESVYLSPTNTGEGSETFFATPPENQQQVSNDIPPTVTCTKVRTEQREMEKKGLLQTLTNGEDFPFVSLDDQSSTLSRASKAMKMMSLAPNEEANSLGTLSMGEVSTISRNLRQLSATASRIEKEIENIENGYY